MTGSPRKLILSNHQAPGDILMLTAALRDLHHCYPGRYLTDVRTPCPDLWEFNPWITPIHDEDPDAQGISCHYPLIHHSNQAPVHFLHGFVEYLNSQLGVDIRLSRFKGDVHLSEAEKAAPSPVAQRIGEEVPYWIIVAGGKYDFTIKWWDSSRYQRVVELLADRVLFVQVGEQGHFHPRMDRVLDLRGKTSLRELVRLVYHAEGVLCPVTFLMHLCAAVETRPGAAGERPCVVVAGGRESPHWEAYPHHQYLHTVGALGCCREGGCWRSRTLPLGDGDDRDGAGHLCVDVVNQLPRCMDLIDPEEVAARIGWYLDGGMARVPERRQFQAAKPFLSRDPYAALLA